MASSGSDHQPPFAVGASVRAAILASPEQLWAWIADPTRHPQLAGSGEPQSISIVGGQMRGVGTRFDAQQRMMGVMPYVSHSEVIRCEVNRRFRFRVGAITDWEFLLEPADGGTLVTHHHRVEPPAGPLLWLARPFLRLRTRQNAASMARTLENLARLVGAPHPTRIEVRYGPPTMD
jgi:hypothetical protein